MGALFGQLKPASFRGVVFDVEAVGMDGGRRNQVHEYPQRDVPYIQDLGRAGRALEFEAFIVGADYVERAEALLGALEKGGAGELVHPWHGTLTVKVDKYRERFNRELGHVVFSLSFFEDGGLSFPAVAVATASASKQAATDLEAASVWDFSQVFATLDYIQDVADQALSVYGDVLAFLSNPVGALAGYFGYGSLLSNVSTLAGLFGAPINLGWSFAGLLNLSGTVKSGYVPLNDATLVPAVRGLVRMANDAALLPNAATGNTATEQQTIDNENAIKASARQLLLVQAVGLSAYLQCAVYDDVTAAKNELAAGLDAEALRTGSDDVYQSLAAARSAMWQDLTERAQDSARLLTVTPLDVLPALVIAYERYGDAGRELEIVERNKLMHSGFVPVAPLLVLSR